jgi:hypothetical protein
MIYRKNNMILFLQNYSFPSLVQEYKTRGERRKTFREGGR